MMGQISATPLPLLADISIDPPELAPPAAVNSTSSYRSGKARKGAQ
jgi:hypothetical protein